MARTLSVDFLENHLEPLPLTLLRLVKIEAERLDMPLYIVGGSVRDLMLGRMIKDFDLIVEGDAREFDVQRPPERKLVEGRVEDQARAAAANLFDKPLQQVTMLLANEVACAGHGGKL